MSVTRKWFLGVAACIVVVSVATICGCTSVAEIRTVHEPRIIQQSSMTPYTPNVGCESSSSTANDRLNSIEDYVAGDAPAAARSGSDFWAGYVEFDDEGWMYDKDQSRANKLNQLDTVMSRLQRELKDPAYAKDDFLVVAFVHGWHHNANDTDCNVHEFRSMLQIANKRYDLSGLGHRRIVGIYVGWRGESIDVNYLNVTTVLDRRNAAERVAKGDVRELFAQLRAMQIGAAAASIESSDGDVVKPHPDRMRTVVIGHSFGGLIAFHGLSPAVLNELTLTKPRLPEPTKDDPVPSCTPIAKRPEPATSATDDAASASADSGSSAAVVASVAARTDTTTRARPNAKEAEAAAAAASQAPVFPDMLVLINPAFEATRFESLHALMQPVPADCRYDPIRPPRPKVVVVTADNDWATGWVFHTAREGMTLLEAYPPEAGSHSKKIRERDANTHAIGFVDDYRTHRLCIKTVGTPPTLQAVASFMPPESPEWAFDRNAPVWVIRAPKDIVNGHDGFLFAAQQKSTGNQITMEGASKGADAGTGKVTDTDVTLNPYLLNWLINLHIDWTTDNSVVMTTDHSCPEKTAAD